MISEEDKEALSKLPSLNRQLLLEQFVTRDMLDAFLAEPPPRKVPAQMKAHHLGSGIPVPVTVGMGFVLLGSFFLVFYVILHCETWNKERILAALLCIVFLVVGSSMVHFFLRHRRRSMRLLRHGAVATGFIDEVEDTGMIVQGFKRFRLLLRYQAGGTELVEHTYIYGDIFKEARRLLRKGGPVPVLYDPKHPRRVLWAGCLRTVVPEPP